MSTKTKDPRVNPSILPHSECCNGSYFKRKTFFLDKNFETNCIEKEVKCESFSLVYSNDFNIHYLDIPSCLKETYAFNQGMSDTRRNIFEKLFNKKVYCYQGLPDRWNGEDYVMEQIYFGTGYNWSYYAETPIEMVANIFKDRCFSELDNLTMGDCYSLEHANLELLKRNKFISKRANPLQVSTTDVRLVLDKLNLIIKKS